MINAKFAYCTYGENTRLVRTDFRGSKTMDLNCTLDQLNEGFDSWNKGQLIQNAFTFLNADEREFILSGTTPEEWEALFGKEED